MFKTGDKVKRIIGDNMPHLGIFLGQIYTVKTCDPSILYVKECPNAFSGFRPDYFELVEKRKTGFGKFIQRIEDV